MASKQKTLDDLFLHTLKDIYCMPGRFAAASRRTGTSEDTLQLTGPKQVLGPT
jgi:ferritin-like metal-binding protein YciE